MSLILMIIMLTAFVSRSFSDVTIGFSPSSNYVVDVGADSTKVFQKAVDDASQNSRVLFLKPGTYIISKPIEIVSPIEIKGYNAQTTVLKLADNSSLWWTVNNTKSGMFRVTDTSDVHFSFLTLDGNSENQVVDSDTTMGKYGIYVKGSDKVSLFNVTVKNWVGYGVALYKTKDGSQDGVVIDYSVIENNNWDGIIVSNYDNVQTRNSRISNNKRHGINIIESCSNIIILKNTINDNGHYFPEQQGGSGVNMDLQSTPDSAEIHVRENVLHNNMFSGITINNAISLNISKNIIDDSEYCLVVSQTLSSNISRNLCKNIVSNSNQIDDISVTDSTNRFAFLPFIQNSSIQFSIDTLSTNVVAQPDTFPIEQDMVVLVDPFNITLNTTSSGVNTTFNRSSTLFKVDTSGVNTITFKLWKALVGGILLIAITM